MIEMPLFLKGLTLMARAWQLSSDADGLQRPCLIKIYVPGVKEIINIFRGARQDVTTHWRAEIKPFEPDPVSTGVEKKI